MNTSLSSLPLVALVGRTNVGKSSLFNALLGQRRALVDLHHGLTRDCLIESLYLSDREQCCLVDTGGLDREHSEDPIDKIFLEHTWSFLKEVDAIGFVIDASVGLLDKDLWIFEKIKNLGTQIFIILHKSDADDDSNYIALCARFQSYCVIRTSIHEPNSLESVKHYLSDLFFSELAHQNATNDNPEEMHEEEPDQGPQPNQDPLLRSFGIFGKPNAGKSSLVNAITRRPSALVSDIPGTTRDYTRHFITYKDHSYWLFDTAGILPKAQKHPEQIERMTYYKTLVAMKNVSTAIFMIDAQEGLSKHDLQILSLLEQYRRGLIIVVNKWDLLSQPEQVIMKERLEYELKAFHYAPLLFISVLNKKGLGELMKSVAQVMDSFCLDISTSMLNRMLEKLIEHHQPPLIGRHRIKPRFVHKSDLLPLALTIHGNQLDKIPNHYHRYLLNGFSEALNLKGIPLRISYKNTKNPYLKED